MTSERWKTIKFWLETCAAAYVVVGAVLQYSVMAVPFIPTILKYGWPVIAGYAAFRIYQFGRSLYERFTKLELDVFGNAVDVDTRLGELADSLQASRVEDIRNIEAKIEKTRKELDSRAYAREQAREKVLRAERHMREGLTQEVSELRQLVASQAEEIAKLREKLFPPPKQETTITDMLFNADNRLKIAGPPLKSVPTPLDVFPQEGMLSKAAESQKGTTNGGAGSKAI